MARRPIVGLATPMPFSEAIDKLASKVPVGSFMNSAEWSAVPVAIRERAAWSATITNARFVQTFQNKLQDFIKETVVTLPNGERALKVGGRSDFVQQMLSFIQNEGVPRVGPRGSITDIGSSARLRLIFNVNVQRAEEYGYWKQGMTRAILDEWPFARFIRVQEVKEPRPVHEQNEDEVRRKDDLDFWLAMNDPEFGGFGVPYGPWGFNSGMGTEDVAYDDPDATGLLDPGEEVQAPDVGFNDYLQTSIAELSPEMREKVLTTLGGGATLDGDTLTANL